MVRVGGSVVILKVLRLATAHRSNWLIWRLAIGLIALLKNGAAEVCRKLAG